MRNPGPFDKDHGQLLKQLLKKKKKTSEADAIFNPSVYIKINEEGTKISKQP